MQYLSDEQQDPLNQNQAPKMGRPQQPQPAYGGTTAPQMNAQPSVQPMSAPPAGDTPAPQQMQSALQRAPMPAQQAPQMGMAASPAPQPHPQMGQPRPQMGGQQPQRSRQYYGERPQQQQMQ